MDKTDKAYKKIIKKQAKNPQLQLTHNVDESINEIHRSYIELNNKIREQMDLIQQKKIIYQQEQDKYKNICEELRKAEVEVKITKLIAKRASKEKENILKDKIVDTVENIKQYKKSYTPFDVENLSYIKLLDKNLQSLEDEAHELKNRLFIIEQSSDDIDKANEKYGSMKELLAKYHQFKNEWEKGAEMEKQNFGDALVKRRNITKACKSYLLKYASLYQEMLELSNLYTDKLGDCYKTQDTEISIDFDDISNCRESLIQEKKSDIEKEIEDVHYSIDVAIEENQKLQKSLSEMTVNEKLKENTLMSRYIDQCIETEKQIDEVEELFNKVTDIARDKKRVKEVYFERIKQMRTLFNLHSNLLYKEFRNISATKTLYSTSLSLGDNLNDNDKACVSDYLNKKFLDSHPEKCISNFECVKSMKTKLHKTLSFVDSALLRQSRKKLVIPSVQNIVHKTRRKINRAQSKASFSFTSMPMVQEEVKPKKHNLVITSKNVGLNKFIYMFKTIQCGGFLYGLDTEQCRVIQDDLKSIINEISSNTKEYLDEYYKKCILPLNRLKMINESVLVREKMKVGVQTEETVIKIDQSVMTEEKSKSQDKKKKK